MSSTEHESHVLILGAGVCGLMAATVLAAHDIDVALVDKGRSVGGRLATRRIGPGRADHGAQFFTARSPEFQTWVDHWQAEGLVYVWSYGWGDGSHSVGRADGYPRYAVRGGMNRLAKSLAAGLEAKGVPIHTGTRIASLAVRDGYWQAETEDGSIYRAARLVATAPVPQTLSLLDAGKATLPPQAEAALQRVAYAPCLCLLIWTDANVDLPEPGARQTPNATVTWMADNQRKGISPEAKIVTVHASPAFSQSLYAAPDDQVQALLWNEVKGLFGQPPQLHEVQVKRWRYALPTTLHPERFLAVGQPIPIYFGGDAFGGPRVEGAALSGLAIGDALVAEPR